MNTINGDSKDALIPSGVSSRSARFFERLLRNEMIVSNLKLLDLPTGEDAESLALERFITSQVAWASSRTDEMTAKNKEVEEAMKEAMKKVNAARKEFKEAKAAAQAGRKEVRDLVKDAAPLKMKAKRLSVAKKYIYRQKQMAAAAAKAAAVAAEQSAPEPEVEHPAPEPEVEHPANETEVEHPAPEPEVEHPAPEIGRAHV